jgi:adenylate kinase family enzyme
MSMVAEKDLGTPLGKKTAEVLQSGGLVSDKIIIELIEDWLRLHGGHGFVFDGFPRTLRQAESLTSILARLRTALDLAIWLEVSEQTVRDRIAGRLQCGECGFTTSSSSAQFSERAVCPYCDGPLVRRNDDDLGRRFVGSQRDLSCGRSIAIEETGEPRIYSRIIFHVQRNVQTPIPTSRRHRRRIADRFVLLTLVNDDHLG